jgi:hypothetical protein
MDFKQFLDEQKEKHAVLAFGRMNPPTTGHAKLVDKVKEVAKSVGGSHHVVLSHSQDEKKNPLSAEQKLKHAHRFFPDTNLSTSDKEHPTFLQHAAKLHKAGATHLHMVAGSDRVEEYKKKLAQYNGKHEGALYNFKHITVHSAGERDPDAEGTEGMSASKMREHAKNNNLKEFKKGVPSHVSHTHAKELMGDVRKGMAIKEDFSSMVQNILTEGVHDKAIFKAVFLSGGPGSGKDYILDNTLAGHGLTEINSDKALEFLMDKNNLDKKMPESEKEARDLVRGKAKDVTELRQKLALLGRNGLIINGTGDDPEKYAKIKKNLESIGYETSMIAVLTKDEVSAQRNIERGQRGGRTVPENIRKEKWDAVSNARPMMAKLFGNNYKEIDNSMDLRDESIPLEQRDAKKKEMLQVFKDVQKFVQAPPKSEQAKQWVAAELAKKDTLPIPKNGGEKAGPPANDGAAEEAARLGLTYFGFGRYGKNGKVTHHSVHGKLTMDPTHQEQQKVQAKAAKMKLSAASGSPVAPKNVKEDVDAEFENFLSEAVSITINADTVEELNQTVQMLTGNGEKEEEVKEETYKLSDTNAFDALTLGTGLVKESKEADYGFAYQSAVDRVKAKANKKPVDMKSLAARLQAAYKKEKPEPAQTKQVTESYTGLKTVTVDDCVYIAQGDKPRIYMLRNSAAKDAHRNNGEVVKAPKGYMVKLKENKHAKITEEFLQTETSTGSTTATSYTVSAGSDGGTVTITESGDNCSCGETSSGRKKITIGEIRSKQKEKLQKESIDKGIESGMSMSAGGEGPRDTGEKLNKKGKATPVAEMQGDETTASIGDKKEDELKKVGISLTSFRKKNYL